MNVVFEVINRQFKNNVFADMNETTIYDVIRKKTTVNKNEQTITRTI